ncbi:MAG: glycosyltransferase [Acidobacteriota bacterium]|nr:glycosyltransferase [Acidobacteriota bacterium]
MMFSSPAKGRVLMLSTSFGKGGGAEEQIMLLSLGLRARGWCLKIVSLIPPAPLWPELENSDIPIASLGMRPGIPDPRAIFRLIRELRAFRPDVVHCHMPQANLLARAVRLMHPIPVVIGTFHNSTMERVNGSSGRFLEIAHGLTDRFTDLTTVICNPGVQSYIERGAVRSGKITVVHNGVNTANYQQDAVGRRRMRREMGVDGLFVWLAVGRFTLAKAYPDMIRATAKMLARSGKPAVLLICGEGPLEAEIRSLVRECGVANCVRFLGLRQDIPQLMNAADGFVMSSRLEGLPMVLLEASSSGLPIVATSVGGNPEAVVDGKTGFIVPPRCIETLAAAMERIMNLSVSEREAMAGAGRAHAREKFDMEGILAHWEKLYTELARRASEKRSGGKKMWLTGAAADGAERI